MAGRVVSLTKEAIRDESGKWTELARKMAEVKSSIDKLNLGLSAFVPGNGPAVLAANAFYDQLHEAMKSMTAEAVAEFNDIAAALQRVLDLFEEAENNNDFDLRRIYEA